LPWLKPGAELARFLDLPVEDATTDHRKVRRPDEANAPLSDGT
jgi:hypothetical protein